MTETPTGGVPALSDTTVLDRTMDPYRAKHSIYLKSAEVATEGGIVTGTGQFEIGESCYIDDTGHFNAAEFIICYNQLMYYTLAVTVRDSLRPEFANWTMDDYWARQLPNVLIYRTASNFSRPIDPRSFSGEFTLTDVSERKISDGMLLLPTTIRFWDSAGGRASGKIALVLTEVPEPTKTADGHP
jgi:hypothetical protein